MSTRKKAKTKKRKKRQRSLSAADQFKMMRTLALYNRVMLENAMLRSGIRD